MIELSYVDLEGADQAVIPPDLDMPWFMREWRFDYAYAHGVVLKILSNELSPNTDVD